MIEFSSVPLKKSINKAYLKVKPVREDFEKFKEELKKFLSLINDKESEEHNINFVRDFLINTFYSKKFVNTKGRTDLAVHLEKSSKSAVGVIIETKSPANKSDMISENNLNCKAMHEVILYYLRERIEQKNDEIKNIIITNTYKWFIFKAEQFERHFYKSKLKNEYEKWRDDKKVSKLNEHFYNEIVKKYLDESDDEIEGVFFDLRDFEKFVTRDKEKQLIPLFKKYTLPELLKEPFANDSNTLNKQFYSELLHIIGLEEYKEKSKKKIRRKDEKNRDNGSLLENTIRMIKSKDVLKKFDDVAVYGNTEDEQLYNTALELNIIWINRVLFLKLLEAQLVNYHNGDKNYQFLDPKVIQQYDDLFELFHEVLAEKTADRNPDLIGKFNKIPYLNSSLFELSEIEKKTIDISSLKDRFNLPFYESTVFSKDIKSKDELPALEYLLLFLDAYDFASESGEEIMEERKTIMNASVLGLIFEKINGYKEGSFYTPGFITMYMARETLRRAIVQKFNEAKGTEHKDYEELRKNIDTSSSGREEANRIINDLKICDPAVGSGHFLVSCLNEIIAIKAELKVLNFRDGIQVQNYSFEIENDELIITNEETDALFNYYLNPSDKPIPTLQELQEALFHEKETLIENCLFGVDINKNSVNICRLRLWIELLKSAYYTKESNYIELETLPNIDINIKQGNSLISRFDVRQDIFTHADKQTLDIYKLNVALYKNEQDREKRRELKNSIDKTKERFRGIAVDPLKKEREQIDKLTEKLHKLNTDSLFDGNISIEEQEKIEKKRNELVEKINKLTEQKSKKAEEYLKLYANAFEWRFEFPEVLDEEGNFIGFDVVIGNPPYVFGGKEGISDTEKKFFKKIFYSGKGKINLFTLFIERATEILSPKNFVCLIIPNTFLRVTSYSYTRKYLLDNFVLKQVVDFGENVFDDAITTAIVILYCDKRPNPKDNTAIQSSEGKINEIAQEEFAKRNYIITLNIDKENKEIYKKLNDDSEPLGNIVKELIFGVVITKNLNRVVSKEKNKGWKPFLEGRDIGSYYIKPVDKYLNYEPSILHRPRTREVFEATEKLLIQRITGGDRPLKAAYDNRKLYNKESINNLILKNNSQYSIKYILALVNSKLMNWFYVNRFTNKSNLTVNLSKEYLSQIPIKKVNENVQFEFVNLVESILTIKDTDFLADTKNIEYQVDQMVYKLYGLTEEERRIVEGK